MNFLILILFFAISCTKKENITNISTNIINQQTNISPEPLVASYKKGLELVKVQSSFYIWYPIYLENKLNGIPNNHSSYENYRGIYWNQNSNQYYYATLTPIDKSIEITYSLDSNRQYEPVLSSILEDRILSNNPNLIILSENIQQTNSNATNFLGNELLYVGSINPLERIYIDKLENNLFIKKLLPVSNQYEQIFDDKGNVMSEPIIHNITLPLFPVISQYYGYLSDSTTMTNAKKEQYLINDPSFLNTEYMYFDRTLDIDEESPNISE